MSIQPVSCIDFFVGNPFQMVEVQSGIPVPFVRCIIRGPGTRILYAIRLEGEVICFTIKFKATGLYRLLGIPMYLFVDKVLNGNLIEQLPLDLITTQLLHAPDIARCIRIVEPYLLLLSEVGKVVPPAIEKAISLLERQRQLCQVSQIATETYMSQRQLERNFIRYVGLSPKTYFRTYRLLHLLQSKHDAPEQKWGSLAHEFGYYDQMHLIREFKDFLKITPSSLILTDFDFL